MVYFALSLPLSSLATRMNYVWEVWVLAKEVVILCSDVWKGVSSNFINFSFIFLKTVVWVFWRWLLIWLLVWTHFKLNLRVTYVLIKLPDICVALVKVIMKLVIVLLREYFLVWISFDIFVEVFSGSLGLEVKDLCTWSGNYSSLSVIVMFAFERRGHLFFLTSRYFGIFDSFVGSVHCSKNLSFEIIHVKLHKIIFQTPGVLQPIFKFLCLHHLFILRRYLRLWNRSIRLIYIWSF